eukprot:gnl/MRDRNA2_/MRDRNA2_117691_c0_seq1.p1 gnl/MRDRNA2_/MRDRNA2_117691_c0~~gnl/MRDRNA2_/MRDRNA2_117691_c0_seq1.p1  ORF type:complete len:130 (+),score=22.10 gnl/MRDRNA2_/MRDRNA2_117691_c0_seq1:104-493(+)
MSWPYTCCSMFPAEPHPHVYQKHTFVLAELKDELTTELVDAPAINSAWSQLRMHAEVHIPSKTVSQDDESSGSSPSIQNQMTPRKSKDFAVQKKPSVHRRSVLLSDGTRKVVHEDPDDELHSDWPAHVK